MPNSDFPLANKAKDLIIYTFKATKPVGDKTIGADEAVKQMLKISEMQDEEQRKSEVKTISEAINKQRKIGFPKSAVHTYIKTLRQSAVNIVRNVQAANDCDGNTELRKRISTISEIINDCSLMLVLLDISYDLGYIDARRLEFWGKLVRDVKYICMSWKKKEISRLNACNATQL